MDEGHRRFIEGVRDTIGEWQHDLCGHEHQDNTIINLEADMQELHKVLDDYLNER